MENKHLLCSHDECFTYKEPRFKPRTISGTAPSGTAAKQSQITCALFHTKCVRKGMPRSLPLSWPGLWFLMAQLVNIPDMKELPLPVNTWRDSPELGPTARGECKPQLRRTSSKWGVSFMPLHKTCFLSFVYIISLCFKTNGKCRKVLAKAAVSFTCFHKTHWNGTRQNLALSAQRTY